MKGTIAYERQYYNQVDVVFIYQRGKMDLQKVGGGCGDRMEFAQDRDRWRALVSTVRNLQVPKMRGIS